MTIRAATDQDTPFIVDLLKVSLGESLMPKSEAFWRWKHVDNPFGKSLVLLAFEGDQLIGIRAFMRWEWKHQDRIYKTVRAVDTATHPQYQGKGIFKKLTLQSVAQCREERVDFIFNTPNSSSKPGYLKMGWTTYGKMNVYIKPVIPPHKKTPDFDVTYGVHTNRQYFISEFNNSESLYMRTEVSEKFLRWRYLDNPNIQYYAFSDNETAPSYLTIFRLKRNKLGLELRICDSFPDNIIKSREYRNHLMQVVRSSGASMITSSLNMLEFPSIRLTVGPEITVNPLSLDHNFLTFDFWKPSLGDMEVF